MKELVAACAVGKIQGKMALDLSDAEDKYGDADLPVALVPNMGLVTLLQMDGNLTTGEFEQGLSMAIEACKTIHTMQRETLKKKFATVKDAVEEREEPEIVA
jgi:exosome complex component RRP41